MCLMCDKCELFVASYRQVLGAHFDNELILGWVYTFVDSLSQVLRAVAFDSDDEIMKDFLYFHWNQVTRQTNNLMEMKTCHACKLICNFETRYVDTFDQYLN